MREAAAFVAGRDAWPDAAPTSSRLITGRARLARDLRRSIRGRPRTEDLQAAIVHARVIVNGATPGTAEPQPE